MKTVQKGFIKWLELSLGDERAKMEYMLTVFCILLFSSCFQNHVEIHVAHIQSGLSQMGNLHAFSS